MPHTLCALGACAEILPQRGPLHSSGIIALTLHLLGITHVVRRNGRHRARASVRLPNGSFLTISPPQLPPAHSEIWQWSSSHSLAPLTSSHSALAPAYRRSSAPHAPPPTLRHHVCSCVTAHHASARRAAATRKLLTAELLSSRSAELSSCDLRCFLGFLPLCCLNFC